METLNNISGIVSRGVSAATVLEGTVCVVPYAEGIEQGAVEVEHGGVHLMGKRCHVCLPGRAFCDFSAPFCSHSTRNCNIN